MIAAEATTFASGGLPCSSHSCSRQLVLAVGDFTLPVTSLDDFYMILVILQPFPTWRRKGKHFPWWLSKKPVIVRKTVHIWGLGLMELESVHKPAPSLSGCVNSLFLNLLRPVQEAFILGTTPLYCNIKSHWNLLTNGMVFYRLLDWSSY
jgi:hypothetical protein